MVEDLTIVVVALLSGEALDECVRTARAQCENILVVRRDGTIVDAEGRRRGMADRPDIPAKRRCGVELAATPLVALLEDTVVPAQGWAEAANATLGEKDVVACGGPVRIAEGLPAQTRALNLSEYGRYNEQNAAGEVAALPGCNFAFRREAVLEAMRGADGLVDLPVFGRLSEMGGKLVWAPRMTVTFAHPFPDGARLKTRFEHGRIYGSSKRGLARRVATAAKALLLPVVLTARSSKQPGRRLGSMATFGWLALQHSAWAAGEFVGAILGPSRNGLGRWR
jgi:hypothetical protein